MKVINEKLLQDILDYVKVFQLENGRSPSYRQIAHKVGIASLETAHKYVHILESRGQLKMTNIGNISVPKNLSKGQTTLAPLVGSCACGNPILAIENIEGTFQLPTALFGNGKKMLLHAEGDSMINAGIFNGDLVVANVCNNAEDGDIVVALIDDSATIKRLYKRNGYYILHPENPNYKDIKVKELIIQGVVTQTIHNV